MIFEQIKLHAFGHFAGASLDFSVQARGLHLIYGANEAGKSTTLRAITALLFGVPEQSADTFLHAGKDVRIGAEISVNGQRLDFVRRKGRKNTLLAVDGSALAEEALEPFLMGVDERLWGALFGLDHESLRAGAQALLAGEGLVGESLFDAGSGTGSVRKLLVRLRDECEALYTRRGRNKRINQQLVSLVQARHDVSQKTTSAVGYLHQETAVADLRSEHQALRARRQELQIEKNRCERLLRTLPLLAQRASLLEQRVTLGHVPALLPDAERRRTDNQRLLEESELRVAHERLEIARVTARLESLTVQDALAALEPARVEEISQRLGGYRKARLDQPKREGELRAVAEEATHLLRRLGRDIPLAEVETLRVSSIDDARVRRLAREKTQADTKREDCQLKIKRSSDVIGKRQRELTALEQFADIASLERSVIRAQKHVEQELQLRQVKERLLDLDSRIKRQQALLAGVGCDLTRAEASPPSEVRIREFELAFQALSQAEAAQSATREQALAKLRVVEQRHLALHAAGEVPSEGRLHELREARDRLLFSPARKDASDNAWLAELGSALRQTDGYADRMFREATRVAQAEATQAELAATSAWLGSIEKELANRRAETEQLRLDWRACWQAAGFEVGTRGVRELQDWLVGYRDLSVVLEQQAREHQNMRRLEASLAEVIAELSQELVRLGETARLLWESLPQFVERAELAIERFRRANIARKDLVQRLELERQQLAELQLELGEIKEAEKLWRPEWLAALKQLGLGRDAGAEAVSETLDNLAELFRKLEEARGLERRISGMQRDAEEFCKEVDGLVAATLPTLVNKPLETKTEEWVVAYRKATGDAREREHLTDELAQRQSQLVRAELDVRRYQVNLDELLAAAGASSLAELAAIERRVAQVAQLTVAIAEEERKIIAHGEGASLELLLEQAKGVLADESRSRIASIELQLVEIENLGDARTRELASAEQQLSAMQEGAATAAEDFAAKNAALTSSVQSYRRLRLAIALLEHEVERYRREHQGPVLGRASQLFPRLTLGRYKGLQVGFDERDQQILLCVTDTGREVNMAGLSDGTRDQLYLGLRVATLERYLERGAPLPVILDDILIHFDDARAGAALSVLADLAQRTQILFFTHHSRIVELGRKHVPESLLQIHELPSPV